MRALVIAGTHSGCGKTTVTLGILAALRKKGFSVQPFKAGPDFIDAGLHQTAAGRPSRNLDLWMCGEEYVAGCFQRNAAGADIAVIEGVMGLYDGDRSTALLARFLDVPVVLVVDAYGMAESAGAVVYGFAGFGVQRSEFRVKSEGIRLAGVIFNRVASENHYERLKGSVHNIPVLGYLPREMEFEIPHRHLGLTTAEENPLKEANLDKLADTVLRYIDLDAIVNSAQLDTKEKKIIRPDSSVFRISQSAIRIAVAYDKAFSFYYEDNLDLLRDAGAELIRFSPLADHALPDADAVYIGGGYPELHAGALSRNASLLGSIRAWAEAGKPMYAECGGLMYLSRGIRDFDDRFFGMARVFPFETRMLKKPRLGYREILLQKDCILGERGEKLRGHEFHYSEILEMPNAPGTRARHSYRRAQAEFGIRNENQTDLIYDVRDGQGRNKGQEGFLHKNTLASYIHLHFGGGRDVPGLLSGCIKGERFA